MFAFLRDLFASVILGTWAYLVQYNYGTRWFLVAAILGTDPQLQVGVGPAVVFAITIFFARFSSLLGEFQTRIAQKLR